MRLQDSFDQPNIGNNGHIFFQKTIMKQLFKQIPVGSYNNTKLVIHLMQKSANVTQLFLCQYIINETYKRYGKMYRKLQLFDNAIIKISHSTARNAVQ